MERLKNQIKPHFIYNSLNTIMWMSKRDQNQTYRLLQNFSDYLRGNFHFSEEEKEVSFEEEMKLTEAYLELEKARFGDKINVVWEIGTSDVQLPRLTLQPLVENAVRHGVCKNENGGTITIRVSEQEQTVQIQVCDDGPGFELEKMELWRSGYIKPANVTKVGVGLSNVHLRLKNIYGSGITIQNNSKGGACVQFHLPLTKGR
jgi:sensor histidine kinase YesM